VELAQPLMVSEAPTNPSVRGRAVVGGGVEEE
jgi:hypothetical protein